MKQTTYSIITTTLQDESLAKTIATALLQKNLAACIQIYPIESFYKWQNEIENSKEILLQIKTKIDLFDQVKNEIETLHDYEIPEIIMTPIIKGNDLYLKWVDEETL